LSFGQRRPSRAVGCSKRPRKGGGAAFLADWAGDAGHAEFVHLCSRITELAGHPTSPEARARRSRVTAALILKCPSEKPFDLGEAIALLGNPEKVRHIEGEIRFLWYYSKSDAAKEAKARIEERLPGVDAEIAYSP
jgi:hypothetical protein